MSDMELIEELIKLNDEDSKMTEKQVKILQAAIEIFSEKGYAATSTSEIARKAGVAEGTIFRHYKTKKDLLFSIVTPTLAKIVGPFIARTFVNQTVGKNKLESFEEFIRIVMKNRFEFVKKNIPIIKILLQEIAFHDEMKEQYQQIFMDNIYKKMKHVVEHFQAKGEVIECPPEAVIRMVATSIIGFLLTRFLILPEKQWNDEEEMERTIQFILHGLSTK